jgi:hypothetical protein
MATVYDSAARRRLHARIDALTPESKARWGRLDVGRMIVHCDMHLRHSLGDLALARMSVPVGRFPLNLLVIYVLPTPKGVRTMDELRDPPLESWIADRARLKADLDRMGALPPGTSMPVHAAFGRIGHHAHGWLAHKHLDHHLSQFGV